MLMMNIIMKLIIDKAHEKMCEKQLTCHAVRVDSFFQGFYATIDFYIFFPSSLPPLRQTTNTQLLLTFIVNMH